MNIETFSVITRKQAKAEGMIKYFTGNPCKFNHISYRYVGNGHCAECSYEISLRQSEKDKAKIYRENNKNKISETYKKWMLTNKEKKHSYMKEYNKKKHESGANRHKYMTCKLTNLKARLRSQLSKSMNRNGYKKLSSTALIVGCDWGFLRNHLEKQFLKGMTWENKDVWDIDHIVPVSSAKNEDDLVKLFHFTNLRPLWSKDNKMKSSKIEFLI